MMDHLRGRLAGGGKHFVVVECAGLGFRVYVSASTRNELPPEGEICFLRTALHFREGGADLYGFYSEAEREIFLATIGVSGVGPKSAISVLSVLGVSGVLAACARGGGGGFSRGPGVGEARGRRGSARRSSRLPPRVACRSRSWRTGKKETKGVRWKDASQTRKSAPTRRTWKFRCARGSSRISSASGRSCPTSGPSSMRRTNGGKRSTTRSFRVRR